MSHEHRSGARTAAVLALAASVCSLGCGGDDETTRVAPPPPPHTFGPQGTDFVAAGGVATSSRFKLVFTVGQSTQNQETMKSSKHRLQGGTIGANGSLP